MIKNIVTRTEENREYFFINIFSILFALTYISVFLFLRIGFQNDILLIIKAFSISVFIILFPFILSTCLGIFRNGFNEYFKWDPFFTILGLLFLMLVSLIAPFFNLVYLIIVLGAGFFTFYIYLLVRNRIFRLRDIYIIIAVIVFSVFIILSLWSSKYLIYYSSPLLYEKIAAGSISIDALFHGAVSNMIKNYNIPSTGLHDTVYMPYHYLSHWVFAQLSKLLDVNAMKFYQIGYPVIFIPLFLKYFMLTVKTLSNKAKDMFGNIWFWLFLFSAFTGLLPKFINERYFVSNFIIVSESYNLSVTLSLITILMILYFREYGPEKKVLNFKNIFFLVVLPVMVFLIGLAKSSTMALFMVVIIFIFIRYGYFRKTLYCTSITLISVFAFLSLFITSENRSQTSDFGLFHFFTNVIQIRNEELAWFVALAFFIFIYFLWSILFIILETCRLKKENGNGFIYSLKKRKTIRIEVIILILLSGVLPGLVLVINGGSANYFSEIQRWGSIVLVLSMASGFISPGSIKGNGKKILTIIIIVVLILGILFNFIIESRSFFDDYRETRNEYNSITRENDNEELTEYRINLINKLAELDELSITSKSRSLLYIPVSNTEFWDLEILPKSLSVPFLIPALSGIAMIYGLPDERLIYTRSFAYSLYRTTSKEVMDKDIDELFFEVKQRGYENLIILDYKNGEFAVDVINDENIYEYLNKSAGILERLYYYCLGEEFGFKELYPQYERISEGAEAIQNIIAETVFDKDSLMIPLDNKSFLESLYHILFNRDADEEGLDIWLSRLENGSTREEVLESFLNSSEFIQMLK